jgi:hypothetical protein
MKTLRLLSILTLILSIGSCSKKDDKPGTFSYTIDGVADQTIKQERQSTSVALTVRPLGGTAEQVRLVLAGAPVGMDADVYPDTGTPAYKTYLNLRADNTVKPGTYPLKLTGTSKNGIVVEKAFNVTVLDQYCSRVFANVNMNGDLSCTALPGGSFQSLFTAAPNSSHISISNFANLGNTVVVECSLDCDDNTISINNQGFSAGGKYFDLHGDGTFTENELQIRFFYDDSKGESVCTMTYKR